MWRHSLPDNKSYDLITGGAGFVGSHLARYLIGMGRSVRILDDLSTGQLSNLGDLNSKIDFLHGSILDDALVKKATTGVQTVYHLAAIASVQRSIENPQLSHEVCATGTLKSAGSCPYQRLQTPGIRCQQQCLWQLHNPYPV